MKKSQLPEEERKARRREHQREYQRKRRLDPEYDARRKEQKRRSDRKRRSAPDYNEKPEVHKKNPEKHRKKNETYYDTNRPELLLYAKNKRAQIKAAKGPNDVDPPEGAVEDYYGHCTMENPKQIPSLYSQTNL